MIWNSAYAYLPGIPGCFNDLETYFDSKLTSGIYDGQPSEIMKFDVVRFGTNLCRRIGDVDLFAALFNDAFMEKEYKYWKPDFLFSDNKYNPDVGINLISSILVAYLSSCKSLFDAGAIALNALYQLKLSQTQRDLNNKEFKKKLEQRLSPNRSDKFEEILADVTIKRNLAIHRTTPFIIPLGKELLPEAYKKNIHHLPLTNIQFIL